MLVPVPDNAVPEGLTVRKVGGSVICSPAIAKMLRHHCRGLPGSVQGLDKPWNPQPDETPPEGKRWNGKEYEDSPPDWDILVSEDVDKILALVKRLQPYYCPGCGEWTEGMTFITGEPATCEECGADLP